MFGGSWLMIEKKTDSVSQGMVIDQSSEFLTSLNHEQCHFQTLSTGRGQQESSRPKWCLHPGVSLVELQSHTNDSFSRWIIIMHQANYVSLEKKTYETQKTLAFGGGDIFH